MRTLLIFYFGVSLGMISAPAQVFLPLPTEDAEWSVIHSVDSLILFYMAFQATTHYRPAGDTLIEGFEYTRLLATEDSTFTPANPGRYAGAYRNEKGRVYFVPPDSLNAQVLYDFNMEVGDTLAEGNCFWPTDPCDYIYLASKDTVVLSDSIPRLRLKFSMYVNSFGDHPEIFADVFFWIEGIGSTVGLLYDLNYIFFQARPIDPPPYSGLLCFELDGRLLYGGSPPNYTGGCQQSTPGYPHGRMPFPDSALWTTILAVPAGDIGIDTFTIHYGVAGDTLIENQTYRAIYSSRNPSFKLDDPELNYYGAFRNSNDRVYLRPENQPEFLLYDFDLQVGDTLLHETIGQDSLVTILLVESGGMMWIYDASFRRFYRFKYILEVPEGNRIEEGHAFNWIAGIGNLRCPLANPESCLFGESSSELICFRENGHYNYKDFRYPACFYERIFSGDMKITEEKSPLVYYPNPTSGLLTIQFPEGLKAQSILIRVFDLQGKKVWSGRSRGGPFREIDLSHCLPGYILYP